MGGWLVPPLVAIGVCHARMAPTGRMKGHPLPNGEYQRFDQILGRSIRRGRERVAFDARCREAMRGKSRDEAREILVNQYERIGEEPPGQPLLDRKLDMLIAPVSASRRMSDVVDSVSTLIGLGAHVKKIFQGPNEDDLAAFQRVDVFAKPNWHHTCQVALDDDAQLRLGETEELGSVAFRDMSAIAVTIKGTMPRDRGGVLEVLVGDRRVGAISDSDSDPYWEVIHHDPQPETTIATQALRTRDGNGNWRLDLGAPEGLRRRLRFEDFPQGGPDD